MLTELLVQVLMSFATIITYPLPDIDLPFGSELASFADLIGSQVGGLDSFIPISEAMPIVGFALAVYLPFVTIYYTVRWLYSVVPVFGQTT